MSEIPSPDALQLDARKTMPLAMEQEKALELLLLGKSVPEAASSAGVSRATLYRWLKHDPAFQAAYNQWHDEMHESCRSRLLTLSDKAADAVEKALKNGDARTALQLLKGLGLIHERPPGPTDPEEVRRLAEVDRTKRRTALERKERKARYDESMSRMGVDGAEFGATD